MSWELDLAPNMPFVPDEWIAYPGSDADLGSMARHMDWSEPLTVYYVCWNP